MLYLALRLLEHIYSPNPMFMSRPICSIGIPLSPVPLQFMLTALIQNESYRPDQESQLSSSACFRTFLKSYNEEHIMLQSLE